MQEISLVLKRLKGRAPAPFKNPLELSGEAASFDINLQKMSFIDMNFMKIVSL